MEFQSAAQQVCYENTSAWLKEIFGEFVSYYLELPNFAIVQGSALAEIAVRPWLGNPEVEAVIYVFSWVVTGADPRPDLLDFLLKENHKIPFGAFGLNDQGDIFLGHTIVGTTCDKAELRMSVLSVANLADDYDDRIVSRWGGETARDRGKKAG